MSTDIVVASPYDSVSEIREIMLKNRIHAIPIVDCESVPLGIITASDLVEEYPSRTLACEIMTTGKVFTVPIYSDIHTTARVMRNHNLHHVIVTDERKVVGIISSFDLLQLVEEHRFIMKNAPTEPTKKEVGHR